nr:hypothetical protein [Tanacetum cinerariifolium]
MEYSMARTPQQNGVAERRNRTLIEAARTMLVDSKLPTTFWAEAVNTACYVQNKVLVVKPHFKTPYELFKGGGPEWLFDLDAFSKSMNYAAVFIGTNSNDFADTSLFNSSSQASDSHNKDKHGPSQASESDNQERPNAKSSTKTVNTVGLVNTTTSTYAEYPNDPLMSDLEDVEIFDDAYDDRDEGVEADYNNLETVITVSHIPTTRIYKDHPKEHIIREVNSVVQTRKMAKQNEAGLISFINKQRRTNHKDFQNCLFACFLSQMEPKKPTQALDDESWAEAMPEELLQFKILNFWTLMYSPPRKRAIGTKWVYRNKRDQRGIVVKNKARLVAHGHRQEEGIDYDEVFAHVARIKVIRGVYVIQPLGFVDPEFLDRVYKVGKALYGLHQAPKSWYETLSTYLLDNGFRRGTIDKTLFIKKIKDGILLVHMYVDDIIFGSTKWSLSTEFEQLMHKRFQISSIGELTFVLGLQSASTPMETHKPLSKDAAGTDVDVHLYRSVIGSLMYLTSSRLDIMFTVCACSRFQVQPKVSHMHAVKRIFRYLKGQPTLDLWYPKDSPLELIAYSDSDYAGASLDRKSTTGGCQLLGSRLISWKCKKQTIMANSTNEAKYIVASNYCGQVLWLQNQLLDYGYNFMQTKIHVDNESAICVVKNHVYHSKTKHIEIRHHFIRDSYQKRSWIKGRLKLCTDLVMDTQVMKGTYDAKFLTTAERSFYCWIQLCTGSTKVSAARFRLELKGYLINDGYADLVQYAGVYFNTASVFLLGFHEHNQWSSIHHV